MEEGQAIGLTQNLYKSAFSAREKKILAELFGLGYPSRDLSPKAITRIGFKLQPSAIEKLKIAPLLQHITKYFVLVESEKVELADDTASDASKAVLLLNALCHKGSYAIGALYLALLDSSNEAYGPPTHYQLAHELKRIIQEECTSASSLTLVDISQSNSEDTTYELGQLIDEFSSVRITEQQGKDLCNQLNIDYNSDAIRLDLLCKNWIKHKGTWAQFLDLVEALLLTRGLGRFTANLMVPAYPNLKSFLEGLKSDWKLVGTFIGFSESELDTICSSHQLISEQISQFLEKWSVPDCGQKTSVILQKLKISASNLTASSLALNKSSDGTASSFSESSLDGASCTSLHAIDVSQQYPRKLKLNIIRTAELNHPLKSSIPSSSVDKMFVETDSLDSNSTSPQESEGTSLPLMPECDLCDNDIVDSVKNGDSSNCSTSFDTDKSEDDRERMITEEKMAYHISIPDMINVGQHSKSCEEASDITEPAEQVPSHNLRVSEEIENGLVVSKPVKTVLENFLSDENLEVTPCDLLETVSTHTNESEIEYNATSIHDLDDTKNNGSCQLISQPIDLSTKHVDHSTDLSQLNEYPVHEAVLNKDFSMLEALTKFGVDFDTHQKDNGKTPLHVACTLGHVRIVKFLLSKITEINSQDKDGNHCLHYKNALRSPVIVSLFLERNVLLDQPNAMFHTPLVNACEIGDTVLEVVELLLKYGALVDGLPTCQISPLLIACEKGHIGIVSLLLKANANVNRKDFKTGETPLMKACLNVRVEVVKLLLPYKPDIELSNKAGVLPITVAIHKGSLEIVKLLIEGGENTPDLNCSRFAADDSGHKYNVTPLCDAFISGHTNITKYLISHGANINTTDKDMQAPNKSKGSIAPLCFACMTDQDQVELVEYVVSLEQFEISLPYIADPIQEALKRGHNKTALLLCEKYGGMEKVKQDARKMKYFQLGSKLNFIPLNNGTSASLSPSLSKPARPSVNEDETRNSDSNQEETPSIEGDSAMHSHMHTPDLSLLPSEQNTKESLNRFEETEDSDGSDELTIRHGENSIVSLTTSEQAIKNVQLNSLDVVDDDLSNSEKAKNEFSNALNSSSPPTDNGESLVSHQNFNSKNGSDDDNPFKPQPKTPPISELSAAESDVSGIGKTNGIMSNPMQLGDPDGGSLQLFQGSAVAVLYDFMQYLILACLQRQTQEGLIVKAEMTGDTKLIHFLTRYFFDMGIAGSHQLVSEFLQGSPSPMNFIFGASFCSREDFQTVLKNVGREDFPDQLMLALHQFPNSDNLPWSGSALIEALFNQSFSVGSHHPTLSGGGISSHGSVPVLSSIPYDDEPSKTYTASNTVADQFPGTGHRLGESEEAVFGKRTPILVADSSVTKVTHSDVTDDYFDSQRNDLSRIEIDQSKSNEKELEGSSDNVCSTKLEKNGSSSNPSVPPIPLSSFETPPHLDSFGVSSLPVTLGASVPSESTGLMRTASQLPLPVLSTLGTSISSTPKPLDSLTMSDEPSVSIVPPSVSRTDLSPSSPLLIETQSGTKPKLLSTQSGFPLTRNQTLCSISNPGQTLPTVSSMTTNNNSALLKEVTDNSTDEDICQVLNTSTAKLPVSTTESDEDNLLPLSSISSKGATNFTGKLIKNEHSGINAVYSESDDDNAECISSTQKLLESSVDRISVEHASRHKLAKSYPVVKTSRVSFIPVRVQQPSKHSPSLSRVPRHTHTSLNYSGSSSKQTVKRNHGVDSSRMSSASIKRSSKVQPSSIKPYRLVNQHERSIATKNAVKKNTKDKLREEKASAPLSSHDTGYRKGAAVKHKMPSIEPVKTELATTVLKSGLSRPGALYSSQSMLQPSIPFHDEVIHNFEVLIKNISVNLVNWKMFGRYLLIDDNDIDNISKTLSSEQEKSIKLLLMWKYKMVCDGHEITYKLLCDALVDSCNGKLISVVRKHHSLINSSQTYMSKQLLSDSSTCSHPLLTDDLSICVSLTDFWENLKPIIDMKIFKGYTHVTAELKFQK